VPREESTDQGSREKIADPSGSSSCHAATDENGHHDQEPERIDSHGPEMNDGLAKVRDHERAGGGPVGG
jgi:hypothetical protein